MPPSPRALQLLLAEIGACRACAAVLPEGPRPIVSAGASARILIAGQAPGRRVHLSGVPWDDPSGDRLRDWLGVDREVFYDPDKLALVPMGFCYPGSTGTGDRPPRPECRALWHHRLLPHLRQLRLRVVIGQYAQAYYLGDSVADNLTDTVRAWRQFLPNIIPLPHPSPRNGIWLRRNPWFERDLVPVLRRAVRKALAPPRR
jgi:uracil-DNA glycosylase